MSKIKRIIEIEEQEFELRKVWAESDNLCSSDTWMIANSKPYDDSGDLISRSELIKKLEEMANNEWNIQVGSSKGLEDAIDVVENAQTIPLPSEQIAWEQGYEAGLAQGKNDRPKGEWKVRPHIDADGDCDGFELYCSECGDVKVMLLNRSFTLEEATERLKKEHKNFCFECGADMRGKENEVQDKS